VLYDISFSDSNNGVAVGQSGKILHTTDGGATWNPVTSGTSQTIYSVIHLSADTVIAGAWNGVLLHSYDAGASWANTTINDGYGIYNFLLSATDTLFAYGVGGKIGFSTDRGVSWNAAGHFTGWAVKAIAEAPSGTMYATGFNSMMLHRGPLPGVGFDENDQHNYPMLSIFPNPANETIFVDALPDDSYFILNATGQIVLSGIATTNTIDVSDLKPGLYFISIESANETKQGKFFKAD
jgi:hypothetical protein